MKIHFVNSLTLYLNLTDALMSSLPHRSVPITLDMFVCFLCHLIVDVTVLIN